MKWVCNKAGKTDYCHTCIYNVPSRFKPLSQCCGWSDLDIRIVKYRHPLEVAIIKEISAMNYRWYHHKDKAFKNYAWLLWRVLREGRKNERK